MSTYAVIAIKRANGTINLTRLLQNGNPEIAGTILSNFYKTTEQVEALLALGEILILDSTPEKSTAKRCELPGYVRDEEMLIRNFDNGKWRCFDRFGKADWISLEENAENK